MSSHHLPSVIPLFVSQKSPSSIDIRGEDIQTIDDLPSPLWGARLDASSFVRKDAGSSPSRATESWSAIWKTPDEEDVLKLSWNLSTGWAITYDHQGKEILSVQGKAQAQLSELVGAHHAAFADALAQQLWHIDSRWADNEQSNLLGHEAAVGHTQNVRQREGTRVCRCLFEPRIK